MRRKSMYVSIFNVHDDHFFHFFPSLMPTNSHLWFRGSLVAVGSPKIIIFFQNEKLKGGFKTAIIKATTRRRHYIIYIMLHYHYKYNF